MNEASAVVGTDGEAIERDALDQEPQETEEGIYDAQEEPGSAGGRHKYLHFAIPSLPRSGIENCSSFAALPSL